MVAGGDPPVEVVLHKDRLHPAVGHECDLLAVKGREQRRWQVPVERARPPDGEDQLHQGLAEVGLPALGLRPQEGDEFVGIPPARMPCRHPHAEVDLPEDAPPLPPAEEVLPHADLEFLLRGARPEAFGRDAAGLHASQ